ncbi:hypothetical protein YC2023_038645 [Brassica napus]
MDHHIWDELQLECPPLGSSFGHCGIYMWAVAPETEDRYTVSHMVTPWQRPYSLRSLVWITSLGPEYSDDIWIQLDFRDARPRVYMGRKKKNSHDIHMYIDVYIQKILMCTYMISHVYICDILCF